jgi:hypothetical protein
VESPERGASGVAQRPTLMAPPPPRQFHPPETVAPPGGRFIFRQVPTGHLDAPAALRHPDCVDEEHEDATLALLALFDIRRDVARIAEALTDGEEEEESGNENA